MVDNRSSKVRLLAKSPSREGVVKGYLSAESALLHLVAFYFISGSCHG